MALDHSSQVQRRPLADRGYDFYGTPRYAVDTLLDAEKLPQRIWEPAAGAGHIARILRGRGHAVVCSDIVPYAGFELDFLGDFLAATQAPPGVACILTNPPFSIIKPFIARALKLVPEVIILARLALLESAERTAILEGAGLARVLVYRTRLPMMDAPSLRGKAGTGMGMAWYRWRRGYSGLATIDRIGR